MKQELILFLVVLCVYTTAMVPRERRAVLCARTTPCGWTNYDPVTKRRNEHTLYNSYCECPADKECVMGLDDDSGHTYVHLCRSPGDPRLDIGDES